MQDQQVKDQGPEPDTADCQRYFEAGSPNWAHESSDPVYGRDWINPILGWRVDEVRSCVPPELVAPITASALPSLTELLHSRSLPHRLDCLRREPPAAARHAATFGIFQIGKVE